MNRDVLKALQLGGQNLLSTLSPDYNNMPYWEMIIGPDYKAAYNMGWPQHNVGRWWDAMLGLEKAIGFEIPPEIEGAMLQNTYRFFDNPDNLCLQPDDFDGNKFPTELHSLRESLMALTSLIRSRNSLWARDKAHKMMETVQRAVNEDCTWNPEALDDYRRKRLELNLIHDPTGTNGRLIEALVWHYQETHDPLAFELARKFAEWHFQNSTKEDGSIDGIPNMSHTHSYLGTLRGLFLFGQLTRQRKYIDRVKACYDVTVRRIVKRSGYTSHDLGYEARGETTSPGDAAQLALWLALEGYPEYLDDAERIVRCRILPSQIVEAEPLKPADDITGDRVSRLSERAVGGFGGMHKHPHGGKMNTTDITCADVHTLTDIYRHIVVKDKDITFVLFHFDYEDEEIAVSVERDAKRTLHIRYARPCPLYLRIPQWAPKDSLEVSVNGKPVSPVVENGYMAVNAQEPCSIQISYGMPEEMVQEETDHVVYTLRFEGDEITGVSPNAPYLPFYPDLT